MIYVLGLGVIIWLMIVYVPFRIFMRHPLLSTYYAGKDGILYIARKEYNRYDGGLLNCYFAHFGGGKTLTVVHVVSLLFKQYNNKMVWCRERKKFVLQKVHIISNVHLNNVPYEELCSLSQVVCCAWRNKKIDMENNTRTIVLVLLDEASSELNSRNFKTNINADFLNTLITSRHFHMSIYYTSQKFKLVDALLRSVTQKCISCEKVWRFMVTKYYDADEMEYAPNPQLIEPYYKTGFFIRDKDYNAYDTLATVERLDKSVKEGDMMSDREIMEMRGAMNPDMDMVNKPSRKFIRNSRKRRK